MRADWTMIFIKNPSWRSSSQIQVHLFPSTFFSSLELKIKIERERERFSGENKKWKKEEEEES